MMKKYYSLGELLINYRKHFEITQNELAARLNVDVRTLQRWENNQTLIKPEKEEDVVMETLLPHQLIRNLNTTTPIPTFYDFSICKYSLTPLTNDLPNTLWLKKEDAIDSSEFIHPIKNDKYLKFIIQQLTRSKDAPHKINTNLILEAAKRLPELNFTIVDSSGLYAGHSIVFPITESVFLKLKEKKIAENEIELKDLTEVVIDSDRELYLYKFDLSADCNDNVRYLAQHYWRFFCKLQDKNYTFCSFSLRNDSYELNHNLGLELIWEDTERMKKEGLNTPPRFYAGNFKAFLSE